MRVLLAAALLLLLPSAFALADEEQAAPSYAAATVVVAIKCANPGPADEQTMQDSVSLAEGRGISFVCDHGKIRQTPSNFFKPVPDLPSPMYLKQKK